MQFHFSCKLYSRVPGSFFLLGHVISPNSRAVFVAVHARTIKRDDGETAIPQRNESDMESTACSSRGMHTFSARHHVQCGGVGRSKVNNGLPVTKSVTDRCRSLPMSTQQDC